MNPNAENARDEFMKHKSRKWKLTDPFNPKQVKADILGWHIKLMELAIAWFTEDHGYSPNLPLRSSCQTGDWSDSATWLAHIQSDMITVEDYVNKMSMNPMLKHLWSGIGYLLCGTPWNLIPAHVREYLETLFERDSSYYLKQLNSNA